MTSLKKNIVFQVSYQAFVALVPLIVTPYVSRVLGAEELGKYAYVYSIAYYFVVVAQLGINSHGSRSIAMHQDDGEARNQAFSNLFFLHILISFTCLVGYVLMVAFLFSENRVLFALMSFYVASSILDVRWAFYGIEKFDITVIRSVVIKVITVILIFMFVNGQEDIAVYTFIMAAVGYFLSELMLFVFLFKYFKFKKPDIKALKSDFWQLLVLFIPTIAVVLCRHIDRVMLGVLSDYSQTGYFDNADKIFLLLTMLVTTMGDVLLPRISSLIASGESRGADKLLSSSLAFCVIVSCGFAFGLAGISEEFVPVFFGEGFEPCVGLLQLLAPVIIVLSVSSSIRKQYLIPRFKTKIFTLAACSGAACVIILNLILIPPLGAYGAAVSTIVAEVVIAGIQIVATWKEIRYRHLFVTIVAYCGVGLFTLLAIRVVAAATSVSVFGVAMELVVGVIVYLILGLAIMPKIEPTLSNQIKRMLTSALRKG